MLIRTLKGPLCKVAAMCAALADLALIYGGLRSSQKVFDIVVSAIISQLWIT